MWVQKNVLEGESWPESTSEELWNTQDQKASGSLSVQTSDRQSLESEGMPSARLKQVVDRRKAGSATGQQEHAVVRWQAGSSTAETSYGKKTSQVSNW